MERSDIQRLPHTKPPIRAAPLGNAVSEQGWSKVDPQGIRSEAMHAKPRSCGQAGDLISKPDEAPHRLKPARL